jgi:antitoxin CptB
MVSSEQYKRLIWSSRRGMLELDLMLVPFVEQCFPQLDDYHQQLYIRLLTSEDMDLFTWLLDRQAPDDMELNTIVRLILDFAAQRATEHRTS